MANRVCEVIGVRFKEAGKIYYFTLAGLDIEENDLVIVETIRGVELGKVVLGVREMEESPEMPFKDIMRKATDGDVEKYEQNAREAREAIDICKKKIEEHKLEMDIIDCEYTFDKNKILFYFTAEGRIDFRKLVRDLASIFRTRIELRQIGVRDEAKFLGGVGNCGREICCKSFLGEFEPVSIKMAKDQGLSLNPNNISGICGRLICCLNYENCVYEEKLKKLPDVGRVVITPNGKGVVINLNVLTEELRVRVTLEDGTTNINKYHVSEIKFTESVDEKYKKQDEEMEDLSSLED